MPYNPCGRAVDIGRRSYKTAARFFSGTDQEVTIKWFRAADDAGTLPFPSRVLSLDWATEPWTQEGIGEVYGAPRPFSYAGPPAGGPFSHLCGTPEDFVNGVPYDPEREPVVYAANGLPVCCQQDPEPAAVGGIEVGGSADVTVFNPYRVYGGVEVGGSADVTVVEPVAVYGGVEVGGSADVTVIPPVSVYGGVEVGGSADVEVVPPGPVPGNTCAEAPLLTVGETYEFAVPGADKWVRWEPDLGQSHQLEFVLPDPLTSVAVELRRGTTCPGTFLISTTNPPNSAINMAAGIGPSLWVVFSGTGGGVVQLRLRVFP